jgi:hypothetical protein
VTDETMTRRDRDQLAQVAKMRARVAKSSIEQRELVLRSQVEDELKALFDTEDALARKAEETAAAVVRQANADLKERLDELAIPEYFRPQIGMGKAERLIFGPESNAARRMSLRQLATSRIKALGAGAKNEIDKQCADTVTALIAGGLSGEEAQRFLDLMPTVEQLMLAPSVAELEAVHDEQRRDRRQLLGGWS